MHPKACLLSLSVSCLMTLGSAGSSTAAPPPPPIPVQAAFAPFACDGTTASRVTGDGHGAYVNGVAGVQCTIGQNQGNFTLDTRTRNGPARTLTYDLSSVIPCPADLSSPNPCPDLCPVQPPVTRIPASLTVPGYLYVQNVLGVQPGTGWQERVATFDTFTVGILLDSPDTGSGNCSTRVRVRALDANTWEICSAPSYDVAVIKQSYRSGFIPVQYLHLPFDVVISRLP